MAVLNYEKQDHIVVITLNKPERLNAMGKDLRIAFNNAMGEFEHDDDARVGILTGVGKGFCVGMDIKERIEVEGFVREEVPREDPSNASRVYMFGDEVTKPVIAAVNGYAMGGGMYLATSADLIIASESAKFQISEVQRAYVAGWEAAYRFGISHTAAMEIALGGLLSAQRAYDMGIVNEVAPASQLMERAMDRAHSLLAVPPMVLRMNRELARKLRDSVPQEIRELATKYGAQSQKSADARESLLSFAEKRPPVYVGR